MPNQPPLNPDALEAAAKATYDFRNEDYDEQYHDLTYGDKEYEWLSPARVAVSAYLAAAQPEVNSVEELDALPHGTVIMATGGQPNPDYPELFLKAGYEWSPWQALDPSDRDDGENMESSGSVLKWRCDGEARVLYRPEVPGA